jgi:predicted RNA-binding Zn-ribbon protein involved in translation (DUF1610 family)
VSTVRCPQGHTSSAGDYCDTCGAPIAPAAGTGDSPCPDCGWVPEPSARFCEACGRNLTTGTVSSAPDPPGPPGAAQDGPGGPDPAVTRATVQVTGSTVPDTGVGWVAEVWVDPDWHATRRGGHPCPPTGPPSVVALTARSVLVGRPSTSRSIDPQVDCSGDPGVSRRQAQLSTDGSRWWVEDLRSANGTWVGPAGGPLPTEPVPPGERRELGDDDRVYLGSWTRLALRRDGTPDPRG